MVERLDLDVETKNFSSELAIHLTRYLPVKGIVEGKTVLDIACGVGYASYAMKHFWGASAVTGVDVDGRAILTARKQFRTSGVEYLRGDAVEWLDASADRYDVITCVETIEHVKAPLSLLSGIDRAANKTSAILVTCPNDHWYYGKGPSLNVHHQQTWTFEGFKELAERVLGTASQWFLGVQVLGYGNYEVPAQQTEFNKALDSALRHSAQSVVVPAFGESVPTERECLYFSGLWLRGMEPKRLGNSAAMTFSAPGKRGGLIPRVNEDMRVGRGRIAILADSDSSSIQHLRKLTARATLRISTELVTGENNENAPVFKRILAGAYCFVVLIGLSALRAYLNMLKQSKFGTFDSLAAVATAVILTPEERAALGVQRKILGLFDRVKVTAELDQFLDDCEALFGLFIAASERVGVLGAARVAACSL